jgi:hypothetical protein
VEALGGRPVSITFADFNPRAILNVRTAAPPHRGPDPELDFALVGLMPLLTSYGVPDSSTSNGVTFDVSNARRLIWILDARPSVATQR